MCSQLPALRGGNVALGGLTRQTPNYKTVVSNITLARRARPLGGVPLLALTPATDSLTWALSAPPAGRWRPRSPLRPYAARVWQSVNTSRPIPLGRRTSFMLLLIATACADSTASGPGWKIDYGVLAQPPLALLTLPDTVTVGTVISANVATVGSSSCTRPAGIAVAGAGTLLQTLTPRDSVATGHVACTDDLAMRPHPVQLRFDEPGTATIRIRGYLDFQRAGEPGIVERRVVVRR